MGCVNYTRLVIGLKFKGDRSNRERSTNLSKPSVHMGQSRRVNSWLSTGDIGWINLGVMWSPEGRWIRLPWEVNQTEGHDLNSNISVQWNHLPRISQSMIILWPRVGHVLAIKENKRYVFNPSSLQPLPIFP